MGKVTKNARIADLESKLIVMQTQINSLIKCGHSHTKRLIALEPDNPFHGKFYEPSEPKPKQVDQSFFKQWPDCWKFFAIDKNGDGWRYREEPKIDKGDNRWSSSNTVPLIVGIDYDTSDWQNSLIERDKVELTGSDLCRVMLARGDVCVPCFTSWDGDTEAIADKSIWLVHDFLPEEPNFHAGLEDFYFAVPINTRTGEPLTATDVGL